MAAVAEVHYVFVPTAVILQQDPHFFKGNSTNQTCYVILFLLQKYNCMYFMLLTWYLHGQVNLLVGLKDN